PIIRWFASNRKCTDETALATAQLLDAHQVQFETSRPSLLVRVATKGMPRTLAFLCQKKESGDPTEALRAIARRNDTESVRVLLAAGAKPLVGERLTSSLFDAAASGETQSVFEMLKHVSDKQDPKVLAAYSIAEKNGDRKTMQIF